jgi:hypothetical protein
VGFEAGAAAATQQKTHVNNAVIHIEFMGKPSDNPWPQMTGTLVEAKDYGFESLSSADC